MTSQKMQEIIISTIENIAKNTILNTNFLTLINGQISYVDQFNNYYNFTYQKEEYTGFSITGEKYEVGDLVYILKLNNDLTSKQMIISKVNSYTNFDIELAISDSLKEIQENINQIEAQEKEISIIGNTVFTLNDDLTITPEELTFSAQKSKNIEDITWFIDGEQQVQDELKKLTVSNSHVQNKDSIVIRVEDLNNSEVYDEVTVIRAMASDTKLELDLGLDSVLLQKNEQGIIDYSKAILTPKVLSNGEDITADGWSFNYKIESGEITIIKEQNNYRITNMNSDKGKISFFAIKNNNTYLQKIIYLSVVTYGDYNTDITISNQNFVIAKTNKDKIKDGILSTTIRAIRGSKILKIIPNLEIPYIGNTPGKLITNDDNSITYSWEVGEETVLDSINGEIKLLYTIENVEYSSIIFWTTVNDGASGSEYRLEIDPPNIIKNGDGTFTPSEIIIKSLFKEKEQENLYNGYFEIYKTINNEDYTLDYESSKVENTITYTISDLNLKHLKINFFDNEKNLLITEYCYVNINSNDFIEITEKTENNSTHLIEIDGQIQGLIKKDETIETTVTNLQTNTEQKFTEINEQYSEINQQVDNVTTTVSSHTKELESINGEIVSQGERLTKAEEKITDEAIINTVTKSENWQQVADDTEQALENSKSIKLNATSTAFSKTKNSTVFIPTEITITPELKSHTFGKYEYATAEDGTYRPIVNGQHGFTLNSSTLVISNTSDLFTNSNNTIIIKGSNSTNSAHDIITIVKISDGVDGESGKPGADAYTAILGNESISISCLNNGNTASEAVFTIPVYSYLGSSLFSCTISVGTLPTGITAQVTNGTSSTNGKIVLNIANNNNLGGAKNGIIQVNININGKVFTKQITWSKAIAGSDGSAGLTGRVYFLEPTTVIIKKGKDNKLNPSNVTFSSYYRDGTSATRTSYLGRFVIQESTNGNSYTTKYTSSTNEGSKTYTPTSTAKTIKCIMYAAGGTTTPLDTQTVAIIEDIDGIEVGGKNLLLNSGIEYSNTNYPTHIYNMSELMKQGDIYTIKIWGKLGDGKSRFDAFLDGGSIGLGSLINNNDGTYSLTFTGRTGTRTDYSIIHIYPMPSSVSSTSTITKIKLEKGNVATDWTPAPEDIEEDLSNVEERITTAEQKLTSTQWSLWFTEVVNNSVATSTKFTMDKNGLHIKGGGIDISNNAGTKVFYADTNGNLVINNLTANNGNFNGIVTANSGKIGVWNIDNYALLNSFISGVADRGRVGLSPGMKDDGSGISYANGLCFWAGATWSNSLGKVDYTNAPFKVRADGSLYASNANISGNITASRGKIASFTISGDSLIGSSVGMCGKSGTNYAFWAGGNDSSTAPFRVGHDGGLRATNATISGTITGSTITGSTITSNSTINVTTDLKVGNNIYLNQNVNTTKKIIFASGNEIWNMYTNSINYISIRSNYRVSLTADNGSYVAVTGSNYSSGGGIEIYSANTKVNINGDIYFTTASDVAVYASIYNGSSNLYLRAGSGYTAIYSHGNAVYYNGEYIDSNWSHGKFYPGNTGVALGGSASNQRWYRLYASNASSESSDVRLKTNISDLDDRYITFLELLRPITYNWKKDVNSNKESGLIAQEVEEAMRKSNISNKEFGIIDYSGDYLSIIYRNLTILLLKYSQYQKNELDKINGKLNSVEAKLNAYINNEINIKIGGM